MPPLTIDQHFEKFEPRNRPPVGEEWEIDRETYDYALNVLPPIYANDGSPTFFMSEFTTGPITARYRWDPTQCKYFACLADVRTDPLFPKPEGAQGQWWYFVA